MKSKAKTRKRKQNAGEGEFFTFHGAFKEKADAMKKEAKTPGAFIRTAWYKTGPRYAVLSPRTENPQAISPRTMTDSQLLKHASHMRTWRTAKQKHKGISQKAVRAEMARRKLQLRHNPKVQTSAAKKKPNSWLLRHVAEKHFSEAIRRRAGKRGAAKPASVRKAAETTAPSSALLADVTSALKNLGYKPAIAKRMADEGARRASGSDFDSVFRAAMAKRNPRQRSVARLKDAELMRYSESLRKYRETGKRGTAGFIHAGIQLEAVRKEMAKRQASAVKRPAVNPKRKLAKRKPAKRNPGAAKAAAAKYEEFHGKP